MSKIDIGTITKVTDGTDIVNARPMPAKKPKAKVAKAKPKKAAKKAKAPKRAAKAMTAAQAKVQKSERAVGKHAAILAAAAVGKLPPMPDFSAPSRARYRNTLSAIADLVKAKDVKGLKAMTINPVDSAHSIMARYRDLSVTALTAQARA